MSTQPKNRIAILVDNSGSMQSIGQKAVVAAVNRTIESIKAGAAKSGQETLVSLVTFGGNVVTHFFNQQIAGLANLKANHLSLDGGNTPLMRAVDETIDRFQQTPDAFDPNVSFMLYVITDGQDNASGGAAVVEKIVKKLRAAQDTDRWTFAFQLPHGGTRHPNLYVDDFIRLTDVPVGNVAVWETTARGIEAAAAQTTSGFDGYFTARSAGRKSVTTFYATTDLSKLDLNEVRKNLVDVSSKVKIFKITKAGLEIRPFLEEKTKAPYVVGSGYYLLMKQETLREKREILIREKGKKEFYTGPAARQMLGLPATGQCKVTPGNHSNWEIYFQAASHNRKLVHGTDLVFMLPNQPVDPTWVPPPPAVDANGNPLPANAAASPAPVQTPAAGSAASAPIAAPVPSSPFSHVFSGN